MIPNYTCERLANSPLAAVVAQVRFAPFPVLDRARFSPFFDGAATDYPFFQEERGVNVVVDASSGAMTTQEGAAAYRFTSPDTAWVVRLGADTMSLECRGRAYDGIADFKRRFSRLAHLLHQLLPKKQLRFGFRFINEIRVPGGDRYDYWYEALNQDVLGYNAETEFEGTVATTISEVVAQRDDGTIRLRRGFLHGSTIASLPAPGASIMPTPMEPFYLIDIDYYDEKVVEFNPDFGDRLSAYNAYMFRVFHWIVGEGELWRHLQGSIAEGTASNG